VAAATLFCVRFWSFGTLRQLTRSVYRAMCPVYENDITFRGSLSEALGLEER